MRKDVKQFTEEMYPTLAEQSAEIAKHLDGFFDVDTGVLDFVLSNLIMTRRKDDFNLPAVLFAAAFAAWEAEKGKNK